MRTASLVSMLMLTVTPVAAGTCLSTDIMDPAGMVVTSPFGVDRTGRASAGYHQGLDMVNSEGAGTPIYSGSSGPITYRNWRGAGNVAVVTSGDTKFAYLHMNTTTQPGASGTVPAGDQIGTMGCAGMASGSCHPHLHLGTLLRGEALAATGASGRTWLANADGTSPGKGAAPLTADQIKSALPDSWYYVNPESFLHRQIPIVAKYSDIPRSTTLPQSCTVGSDGFDFDPLSAGGTVSASASLAGAAGSRASSSDYSVKMAGQPSRSLYLELARQNATALAVRAAAHDSRAAMDVSLALMVASLQDRGGAQ